MRRHLLQFHRFGWPNLNLGQPFLRLPLREQGKQRAPLHGFDDQPIALFADNGFIARQLEVARNPQRLVAAILEQADVTLGVHMRNPRRGVVDLCLGIGYQHGTSTATGKASQVNPLSVSAVLSGSRNFEGRGCCDAHPVASVQVAS